MKKDNHSKKAKMSIDFFKEVITRKKPSQESFAFLKDFEA